MPAAWNCSEIKRGDRRSELNFQISPESDYLGHLFSGYFYFKEKIHRMKDVLDKIKLTRKGFLGALFAGVALPLLIPLIEKLPKQ